MQGYRSVHDTGPRNQTLFTAHSPFMVGTDELDLVRIVELPDRRTGSTVHDHFAVGDPASLFRCKLT